ncbi:MFS transporter [Paraburkholderia domus]|uniref:MFS transporter n=1 Tax=Paraburkholderia domus TaxID=2793075 RepID=UPI001B023689|nr:MFS transporter [Paraburkholderia domus]CAE6820898.1 Proline/betaine transporter [Paraburkholderia domus]
MGYTEKSLLRGAETAGTDAAATALRRKQVRRAVIAASIGNALEWFDMIAYGTFALIIAKLFFPTTNESASLLLALATFGVSFLMRPLGAIVLGSYADRAGRKAALTMSIFLMMIGTLIIVVVPTHAHIGIAASVIILIARLIQGFSAGGEFGSATAFLIEYAPDRRAYYASWQVASQGGAILLAALFGAVLNATLTQVQLESWGWRVPFIFGLLIAPVGYYIRRHMEETPEFSEAEASKSPLSDMFSGQKLRLLVTVGFVALGSVGNYLALYMPTYSIRQLGLPATVGFMATLVVGVIMALASPYFGALADRKGPARVMTVAAALTAVLCYPLFSLVVNHPTVGTLMIVQVALGTLATAYFAPMPALMSAIFPVQVRTTGLSLGYNIAVTVFGGFAPFILTWLIASTGSKLSPSYYLLAIAGMALVSLTMARRKFGQR